MNNIPLKNRLKQSGFKGDVANDTATRLVNATDNSIYQLMPEMVIAPKDKQDLKILIQVANEEPFKQLKFTPRGGGTGTNGQSLTEAIVVDTSRYMTHILELDEENKCVTVEPGVILSQLDEYLKPFGLHFPPSISTANRATIGGMIGTDAAGKGSLIYGKTSDHIASIEALMVDGTQLESKPINEKQLQAIVSKNDREGRLYSTLHQLLNSVKDEIQRRFPPLTRALTGYNLKACFSGGDGLDLNYLLTGAEGTLAFTTQVTLKLLDRPRCRSLVVVHYSDFSAALDDAIFLAGFKPLAIETVDDKIQDFSQALPEWLELKLILSNEEKKINNFIEFVADSQSDLKQKVNALADVLKQNNASFTVVDDEAMINALWEMRSKAVGIAARMPGKRKPIAFVEDVVVAPEHLAAFNQEFRAILDKHHLEYAMYGHVDVGCLHVRPSLDMQDEKDRTLIRPISEEVVKLVQKYHGLFWGEHGKGIRGEFIEVFFGPVLYPILIEIKRLFDPDNRLNPGKFIALNDEALMRIDKMPMRGEFDQEIKPDLQEKYEKALICNGNGVCFNRDISNVMCPSYKVTNDRIHSPKGRTSLIREWLRRRSLKIQDDTFEHQVFDAMAGCLGCKGCAGKCPLNVSIPDLNVNFLNTYYKKHKRSMRERFIAHSESLIPKIANFAAIYNLMIKVPGFQKVSGLIDAPKISTPIFPKALRKNKIPLYRNVDNLKLNTAKPAVAILCDVFTTYLEDKQPVFWASYYLLEKMGFQPIILYPYASGKSLSATGCLPEFHECAEHWIKLLNKVFAERIPVIGLESSVSVVFRDEYKKFMNENQNNLQGTVLSLAEFLQQNKSSLPKVEAASATEFQLLPHCTEQAMNPDDQKYWQDIFTSIGLSLSVKAIGCCGMAGMYGHLKEQQLNSHKLFDMHWREEVNKSQIITLATGFSCRSQVKRCLQKKVRHPVEVLSNFARTADLAR